MNHFGPLWTVLINMFHLDLLNNFGSFGIIFALLDHVILFGTNTVVFFGKYSDILGKYSVIFGNYSGILGIYGGILGN